MVKELRPKTDLIFLLSHLSYQKDMELAQTVPGIHLIIGSHTGINLPFPPVVNNRTIILQTVPKGMYAGRLDLTLYNHEPAFHNTVSRQTLEQNLKALNSRLSEAKAPEADQNQWRKLKEEIERALKQLHGKNEFTSSVFPLGNEIKDHPDIRKMVEVFRSRFPESGTSQSQN
jgi:2',3'-cyclic-nucleotide 2'-phosphodiesterase (5'-nucleotidase family)